MTPSAAFRLGMIPPIGVRATMQRHDYFCPQCKRHAAGICCLEELFHHDTNDPAIASKQSLKIGWFPASPQKIRGLSKPAQTQWK
jgi:hypothetical protein